MKKFIFLIFICLSLISTSCTENVRARTFGGTLNINVKKGYKVTSATWKDTQLFYFIEPMEPDYKPKEKYFIESSSWGIIESEVVFSESK